MFEQFTQRRVDDDDEGLIFVGGLPLAPESIDSAIDALALDEMQQADEARRRLEVHLEVP